MKKDISLFFSKLILPSGSLYTVSLSSLGFLGKASNYHHRFINLSKAGRKRWLGFRPVVRGVAMNPVDHPHGGGEGKSSGGRPSSTPWGFYTKGKLTRKKKTLKFFIRKLKKRKKK
jgi:large subunit ribosomal protein L2